MARQIDNVNPILFNAAYDSAGALYGIYETVSLVPDDHEVEVTIDEISSTQLRIADFTYSGILRNVYAFSIDSAGGLTAWSRVGSTSQGPTIAQSSLPAEQWTDIDFVAIAVTNGSSAPTPGSVTAATQQGGRVIRVKIRKDDAHPIGTTHGRKP
jgi:hypothetical protein